MIVLTETTVLTPKPEDYLEHYRVILNENYFLQGNIEREKDFVVLKEEPCTSITEFIKEMKEIKII